MKTVLRILIPILLLGGTYGIAKKMIASRKQPQKQELKVIVPEVTVTTVSPERHSPPVESYGTVRSFFETKLTSQVSGKIISISPDFRVGRRLAKGTVLAEIDPTDYKAALTREKASFSAYQSTFAEETIKSEQAREDWLASGRDLSKASPFVLRIPQLNAAKANMAASEAAIKKAEADLERCSIKAPFDAVISQRDASLGAFASAQSTLGSLISTELVSVRLPLTPEQSQRLDLPHSTADAIPVSLQSPVQPGVTWEAQLVRTAPSLDTNNQVTIVIAEIQNPYASTTPLSVGTFVTAKIPAKPIAESIAVPEAALVKDAYIWLVSPDEKLVRVEVERISSHEGQSFLTFQNPGFSPPYRVVNRPLTNFRSNTTVKIKK